MTPSTNAQIATAVERLTTVLQRRPEFGLHDDAPATACWQGGLRVVSRHDNGTQIATDLAPELGGTGDHVSPGWLSRAGLAACTASVIALMAASRGIALEALEVHVGSRSDVRGTLGMHDERGAAVPSAPRDMRMQVRVSAQGVAADRLRALVEEACRCSPIAGAMREAMPLVLSVEIDAGAR